MRRPDWAQGASGAETECFLGANRVVINIRSRLLNVAVTHGRAHSVWQHPEGLWKLQPRVPSSRSPVHLGQQSLSQKQENHHQLLTPASLRRPMLMITHLANNPWWNPIGSSSQSFYSEFKKDERPKIPTSQLLIVTWSTAPVISVALFCSSLTERPQRPAATSHTINKLTKVWFYGQGVSCVSALQRSKFQDSRK